MSTSPISVLVMALATSVFSISVPVSAEPGEKGPGNDGPDYQWQRDNPYKQGEHLGAVRSPINDLVLIAISMAMVTTIIDGDHHY
ncbi:hypothetical protein [Dickeya solani]|uniref:Uncharacterized protein n=1 Tax=Dickeya solani TaxID=1089444 RepID=A0AAX4EUI2_9GAMM|nr:hypothetical protein [Dickeya solani]WOA51079.1 hypothetical protein RXA29_14180 [Dickeya solani]